MARKPNPRVNVAWRIYCTSTNSTTIVEWHQPADIKQLPQQGRKFVIKGGAGVAQKRALITMLGTMTEASQDDMAFLNAQLSFERLLKSGFVSVMKASGWVDDPDAVAADMMQRDGSAPLVANDYDAEKNKDDMTKTVAPLVGGKVGYSPTL